ERSRSWGWEWLDSVDLAHGTGNGGADGADHGDGSSDTTGDEQTVVGRAIAPVVGQGCPEPVSGNGLPRGQGGGEVVHGVPLFGWAGLAETSVTVMSKFCALNLRRSGPETLRRKRRSAAQDACAGGDEKGGHEQSHQGGDGHGQGR